jgi:uncharacterized protein (DUF4415 family)
VALRSSRQVIGKFKAPGWQSRMDGDLRRTSEVR